MIITLDFESEVPIYLQLRHQIVIGIAEGKLEPGESLPTTRQLAKNAGINPMTVSKAYQVLKAEGYISMDRRHGAKVSSTSLEGDVTAIEASLKLIVAEAKVIGISYETLESCMKKIYSLGEKI